MKTLKTPFALSLCIAVLTLCACGGGSAGSARSGQEAAEAPCLFPLYTIESVSEQDAFHTMFYEGTLYMIRQEENLISRFSPSGEIEDFLHFTEPRSPIDMYVSPEGTFSVLCSEGENDRFCINDYSILLSEQD